MTRKRECINENGFCDENVLSMYLKEINRIPLPRGRTKISTPERQLGKISSRRIC